MSMTNHAAPQGLTQITLRALVRSVLENAEKYDWSLQGFGMLRTYISKDVRLHVWDSRYAVARVSTMHDHPWDFASLIVAGIVWQRRYTEANEGEAFQFSRILCGPNGCMKTDPQPIRLQRGPVERYAAGESYAQAACEIHQSMPEDGTVTIITRTFQEDEDHARVFWRDGQSWVSAEPRKATPDEVRVITGYALWKWFGKEPACA